MPEVTAATVLEEMRGTHEKLKEYVDKEVQEVRKNADSSVFAKTAVEKINNELTELRSQYDELVKQSNRPLIGQSDDPAATPEQLQLRSAFEKFLRFGSGENSRNRMSDSERRALSSSSDKDGGFLTPASFESELIKQAYNDTELRPLAQVSPTGRDTVLLGAISKPVVGWGTTNLEIPKQDLSTGVERLEIFDLRALTLISNNTLEDSDSDVWGELLMQFSMAIAEAEDDAFALGAGHNSPQGVLADDRVLANLVKTGVAAGISNGSNNGVDALITMLHSLKKTYRRNSTWMMNSTTEGEVRKLKDSNGQYLWQPPVQAGSPPILLGRPIANPEAFPDIAANSSPIVLGDMRKGYKIRDRSGVTVQRLVERYAEFGQTGFIVKKRTGGQVVLPEAFVTMKVAV